MLFNLQNSYASSKKLFSLLVDKNNAHQVHKYDVKNQSIFLYPQCLSKDVSKQTRGTKNLRDLLHGQTRIAIHSTLFIISKKYIRHGLGESNLYKTDHPQRIQNYRRNCRSPGYYCRRRAHRICSSVNTRQCLMGIKCTTSQPRVGCYDEKCFGESRYNEYLSKILQI